MYVLQNLHWFGLMIGSLVFFHELGHFLAARFFGVSVLRFSIGFGPKILAFTRGGTEYRLGILPLGGFVKMAGDVPGEEVSPEEAGIAFNSKPAWQRAVIAFAGPAFNFILAWVVYTLVGFGSQTIGATKLGMVQQDGPAWAAGLRPGDVVQSIDGEEISDWQTLRHVLASNPKVDLKVTYMQPGYGRSADKMRTATLTPDAVEAQDPMGEVVRQGRVGISLQYPKAQVAVLDTRSPAALAGLRTGDMISHVGDQEIVGFYRLQQALSMAASTGQKEVRIRGQRAERLMQWTLALEPAKPDVLPLLGPSSADWHKNDIGDASAGANTKIPQIYTGLVAHESVVAVVDAKSPADKAGIKPLDRLLTLQSLEKNKAGEKAPIRKIAVWAFDLLDLQSASAEAGYLLTMQRGRSVKEFAVYPIAKEESDALRNRRTVQVVGAYPPKGLLGAHTQERFVGPIGALGAGIRQVAADMGMIGTGLLRMVSGRISLDDMGGPILMFVIAEKSGHQGLGDFLRMLALMSVNLGLINLLPVPVLDGGHLVFCLWEGIRRKPASLRVREMANLVGLAMLGVLMVWVIRNDVVRFILP